MRCFAILLLLCSGASAIDAVSKDHPISGVISLLQKLMIEAKEEEVKSEEKTEETKERVSYEAEHGWKFPWQMAGTIKR